MAHMELRPQETLLDVGCGTGALLSRAQAIAGADQLTGVDLSPSMLAHARAQLPVEVALHSADAAALPFADASFDVVASCNVFHYIREPVRALTEMVRVVRPGGRIVITDWCHDFIACRVLEWWLRWRDPAHYRTYGSRELTRLVEANRCRGVACSRYRVDWWWGMMTVTGYVP
jgi:ubiquinone/menaquinone biosynthesis C-methylase UbiE